jgi:predicted negative regulator of RcsB-dependent stress response
MDNAKDDELKMVARLRLARVQAAQGKYDEALGTLKVENAGEFASRLADTRGDVLLAKGDRTGALKEYLAARSTENNGRLDFELLDLKIRDLGGTPPASPGES